MSDRVTRIKDYSSKLETQSETTVKSSDENEAEVVISKEAVLGIYKDNGIEADTIDSFCKVSNDIAGACHHIATKKNIERIKEAVKKDKDWTKLSTHVTAKVGRNLAFAGSSRAVKTGEVTRPDKTKVAYTKFNQGSAQMLISGGLPAEMVEEQVNETKKAVEKSKYFEPFKNQK